MACQISSSPTTYSVFAPASNHCFTIRRSASVMLVALFMGMILVTTTCWYTAWAWLGRGWGGIQAHVFHLHGFAVAHVAALGQHGLQFFIANWGCSARGYCASSS